ncbi:hypothetical protein K438DRAFT_529611 [Mycena galopus ATCC 62051]|nr:hypothetical protein K438DRAFT_529611 [Mycena galopus ATCC 62051]
MHRSLDIAEIRDSIFAQLQDDKDYCDYHLSEKYLAARKIFAALARTCKSFRDPALDLLWQKQETLVNVFKCLPSHLWQIQDNGYFRLKGDIFQKDWDQPLAYASRIRTLELSAPQDLELVYKFERIRVDFTLRRDFLFPNLREIKIRYYRNSLRVSGTVFPALTSCASLFRSPRIVSVDISFNDSTLDPLRGLPIRYAQLTTLRLFCTPSIGVPGNVLSNGALGLNRIEHLSGHFLDRAAMEHISQLSGLRSLILTAPAVPHLPSPQFRASIDQQILLFPVLRHVHFLSTTIEFAVGFLLLSDWSLVYFFVGTEVHATKWTTRQLYTTLATCLSHSALQTLSIIVPDHDHYDEEIPSDDARADYVVDGHILAVLFCFTNLTEIRLEASVGFDIDDAMAWDMARAWPRLEELRLRAARHAHHPPRMTLLGLNAFATHCSGLCFLHITFDASAAPLSDGSAETISPQLLLIYIDIGASPITDPPAVAKFLGVLFPNLKKIARDIADPEDLTDEESASEDHRCALWQTVNELLTKSAIGNP